MRFRTLLALALMAALGAVAAVAVAAPPPGKGKPDRPAAAAKAEAKAAKKDARAKAKAAKLAAKRVARLQAKEETQVLENCRPRVSYLLKGSFVSASESSLVLLVQKTNKHARAFVGKQATVTLGDATRVRGGRKLAAAVAGDKVVVHVRACKDKGESAELYAKKVVVTPTKAKGEKEEETGSTSTETSTTESTESTTTDTTTETTTDTTTETTP